MIRLGIVLVLLGFASAGHAQTFENRDQIIAEHREFLADSCKAIELTDAFLFSRNINGDKLDDLVVDYAGVICAGQKRSLCGGTAGCSMTLYLQQADGSYVHLEDFFARGVTFDHPETRPPGFLVALHGNECGRSGVEPCTMRYQVDGNKAVEVGEEASAEGTDDPQ